MATQLRRYEIAEGRLDDIANWFPAIVPVRAKFGFTVEFAYADRDAWFVRNSDLNKPIDPLIQTV